MALDSLENVNVLLELSFKTKEGFRKTLLKDGRHGEAVKQLLQVLSVEGTRCLLTALDLDPVAFENDRPFVVCNAFRDTCKSAD